MTQFEVHTDHIPTKEEELNWKKQQLKETFGKQFNELYSDATSLFNTHKKDILRNKPIK